MKAEIITYETSGMNNSTRSTISKRLFGYIDRTKNSKYVYKRDGILTRIEHIVITKKTIVVNTNDAEDIKKIIRGFGAKLKSWKIQISDREMKKRCG